MDQRLLLAVINHISKTKLEWFMGSVVKGMLIIKSNKLRLTMSVDTRFNLEVDEFVGRIVSKFKRTGELPTITIHLENTDVYEHVSEEGVVLKILNLLFEQRYNYNFYDAVKMEKAKDSRIRQEINDEINKFIEENI